MTNLKHEIEIENNSQMVNQYVNVCFVEFEIHVILDFIKLFKKLHPDNVKDISRSFLNSYKLIKLSLWQSMYVTYHKLFSRASDEIGFRGKKFILNEKEVFKNVSKELIDFHSHIMEVRNHYFVHGGSSLFSNNVLIAIVENENNVISIQLETKISKNPTIHDDNI
jgi:hypothetical protein